MPGWLVNHFVPGTELTFVCGSSSGNVFCVRCLLWAACPHPLGNSHGALDSDGKDRLLRDAEMCAPALLFFTAVLFCAVMGWFLSYFCNKRLGCWSQRLCRVEYIYTGAEDSYHTHHKSGGPPPLAPVLTACFLCVNPECVVSLPSSDSGSVSFWV